VSRFWQTVCLIQFVGLLLLRSGTWWWGFCAAALVFDLVQLWLACRKEAAARSVPVVVIHGVDR
jgi:hypothetical protein